MNNSMKQKTNTTVTGFVFECLCNVTLLLQTAGCCPFVTQPARIEPRGLQVHTAVFKMDNQQGSTVEYMELSPVLYAAWVGGEFRGEWIHVCAWLSHFSVHLKLSQHC